MKRILLTGGRAPVTLELARLFHAAGHVVFMAESVGWHLSWPSRAIARNVRVPPPNREPDAYLKALLDIVQREKIDLLLPTCEEIFYVARGYEQLALHCKVLVEPLERLRPLHNKWLFVERAQQYGLTVPPTHLLTSQSEVRRAFEADDKNDKNKIVKIVKIVLKPVYSRFAAKTIICPRNDKNYDAVKHIQPTRQQPWVAQEFIDGRQLCTYSVVHKGRIVAHTAYPTEFSAGQGATILFRHIEHSATFKWVQIFVEQAQFTGQIAFDFIETADKQLFALECNPRATSGIHLLAHHPHFWQAFFDSDLDFDFDFDLTHEANATLPLTPPNASPAMLASAMLLYGLPAVRSRAQLRQWASSFRQSRDVIFRWHDPLPALFQFVGVGQFLWWSVKHRISALEASTFDIEWNGEEP